MYVHEISFGKPEKTFSDREMKVKSLLSILGEKQVSSVHASTPEHHIILLVEFIIVFVKIFSVFYSKMTYKFHDNTI